MIDDRIIEPFEPVSLEEMGKVKLMNRIDTKFVAPVDKICDLLKAAAAGYYIQEIDGQRIMPYYTRYFDTPEADMFYQHQRGKKTRQKIRIRDYEDSYDPPFLEIKNKDNKGHTRKKRVEMEFGPNHPSYAKFLNANSRYDAASLKAQIENHFFRITLVNKEMTERVTIDTDLEFHNLTTDRRAKLPDIGIIEWKRDGRVRGSLLDKILKDLRIHESGFSKYCIGMAITNPALKHNRLKKRLRGIDYTFANESCHIRSTSDEGRVTRDEVRVTKYE